MTRALAQEYGRYGIRANIVLPGTVRTPIWDERKAKDPNVLKMLERWYPLGRIVEPDEVARVIAFLASDARERRHRGGDSGRLRADRRQHRHGARTDARRFLEGRYSWTVCASG